MKCDEIIDLLSEYIDGELDADRRRDVEAHVAGCERCRRELESLKATVALVGSLSPVKAPGALAANVADGLNAQTKGTIIWPSAQIKVLVPLLAAAGVLVVVSIMFLTQEHAYKAAPEASREVALMDVVKEEAKREADLAEAKPSAEPVTAVPAEKPAPRPPAVVEIAKAPESTVGDLRAKALRRRETARDEEADERESAVQDKSDIARRVPGKAAPEAKDRAHAVTKAEEPRPTPAITVAGGEVGNKATAARLLEENREQPRPEAEKLQAQVAQQTRIAPADGKAKEVEGRENAAAGTVVTKGRGMIAEKVAQAPESPAAPQAEPMALAKKAKAADTTGKAEAAKAGKSSESAPAGQTIVVRSRNPQADMARVRDLLARYSGQPTEQKKDEAALMLKQTVGDRVAASLPADRLQAFLGDLKHLGLTIVPPPEQQLGFAFGRVEGQAGGTAQQRADALQTQTETALLINVTIVFEKAD